MEADPGIHLCPPGGCSHRRDWGVILFDGLTGDVTSVLRFAPGFQVFKIAYRAHPRVTARIEKSVKHILERFQTETNSRPIPQVSAPRFAGPLTPGAIIIVTIEY